jgi:hypothetical protein
MNNWNRLLTLLDMTIGFPNKMGSSVKKTWQGFDQRRNEHVIILEYRIKVKPGFRPATRRMAPQGDRGKMKMVRPSGLGGPMALVRELLCPADSNIDPG